MLVLTNPVAPLYRDAFGPLHLKPITKPTNQNAAWASTRFISCKTKVTSFIAVGDVCYFSASFQKISSSCQDAVFLDQWSVALSGLNEQANDNCQNCVYNLAERKLILCTSLSLFLSLSL